MKRILIAIAALVAGLLTSPAAGATAIDGYLVVDDTNTGQIYRLTQLGTDVTQLTHVSSGRSALAPRWSPDGRRIAFVIASANFIDRMYTMSGDGTDRTEVLTDSHAYNNDVPDYFPDGQRIAFARCHTDGSGCVLASVRTDGTGLRELTRPAHEVYDFYPDVSPDGSRIAFTRFDANGVLARIWVVNADGSGAHAVTAPRYEAGEARWSPDGAQLIFSTNCCRAGGNVYRVPAGGGVPTQLTFARYPNYSIVGAYAPSGREIVYLSDLDFANSPDSDLYVMRADGAHQVKVPTGLSPGTVDWGPSPLG